MEMKSAAMLDSMNIDDDEDQEMLPVKEFSNLSIAFFVSLQFTVFKSV